MKILIVGGGSIGLRHERNLRALGVANVQVIDPIKNPSQAAPLGEWLQDPYDAVFICTPSHLHAEQALEVMKRKFPLFIEKPAAHSKASADLLRQAASPSIITMVGCNMRFHPGPKQVKQIIEEGKIGKVIFGRFYSGSYLPEWRSGTDYKKSYSANSVQGGGCLLDCIHEIDLASWMLGEIENVYCHSRNSGTLGIDVEDIASMICVHPSGASSEIHLDYIQRTYERGCEIIGAKGSIYWKMDSGIVRLFEAETGKWTDFPQPTNWDLNQMYVDEISHFLDCVKNNRQTVFPIQDALKTVDTVTAAKLSSKSGKQEVVKIARAA